MFGKLFFNDRSIEGPKTLGTHFPVKERTLLYFSKYGCWLIEILLGNPKGMLRKRASCVHFC